MDRTFSKGTDLLYRLQMFCNNLEKERERERNVKSICLNCLSRGFITIIRSFRPRSLGQFLNKM